MKKLYFLVIAFISLNSANAQWTAQASGTTNDLYSINFVDSNLGFAVGERGTILKTTDGGTNWIRQNSGSTTNVFFSVFFVNPNIGYIATVDNSYLKTTDGGITWVEKSFAIENHCVSLFFLNADTGWISSGCGEIFKTTNGGDTWTKQLECGYFIGSLYFVDANIGYGVGDYGNIIKTTDGGANWIQQAGNSAHLSSTFFLNADTGYAVGGEGRILKTINGGITWANQNEYWYNFSSVAFTDVNTGIVVGIDGVIWKTTNGGETWNPQISGTNKMLLSIYSVDANISYAVGMNGTILKTTCGGGVTTTVNSATICNGASATLIASGAKNYVWSTGDTTASITVKPTSTTNYIVTGSISGCSDTALAKVNVYNLNVTAQNQTLTCGGKLTLNTSSNYAGEGNIKYAWRPRYGLNDTTIANPAANPKNSTTYTITASTSDGCLSSNTSRVDVEPFMLTITDKYIVCGGSASLSTNTNYPGTGILSYSWQPGNGLTDSLIASPNANPNHTIAYSVSAKSTDGCSTTKNVTVNVSPLAIAGSSMNINCGNSTTLQANTNYTGSGPLTYLWQTDNNLNYSTIANPIVQPIHTTIYRGTISTDNGCSASNDFIVNVNKIADSPEICIVTIDSSNKNVVIWNKPSTSAIDSFYIYRETEATNVYTKIGAVSSNEYSIFVDTNSFPNIQSNKYEISIFDKCNFETQKSMPHKTMHLSINQGTGNSWNLIWEGYEGFQVSTYKIYRGSDRKNLTLIGTSPASNTQYSDFNAPAGYVYYQIEIISPNTCNPYKSINAIRSNIATNAPLALNERSNADFKMYPNPASDYLIIETKELASECTLSILNINGQELIKQVAKDTKVQIDINNLPAGVYFLKLIADKSVEVRKFIKK
jgi:photosystem II stability/assembly factor-like uncharacterized protein